MNGSGRYALQYGRPPEAPPPGGTAAAAGRLGLRAGVSSTMMRAAREQLLTRSDRES